MEADKMINPKTVIVKTLDAITYICEKIGYYDEKEYKPHVN